jgi:Suv3 C-terminal domain 1
VPLPLRARYLFCCAPINKKISFVCAMFLKVCSFHEPVVRFELISIGNLYFYYLLKYCYTF